MNRLHQWYCRSDRWKRQLETGVFPWVLDKLHLDGAILEIGPGPGLTTDWLRRHYTDITCLEVDPILARSLRQRIANANVNVQVGDATDMPFPEAQFSAVLSFTMLHHVPSSQLQDRLFAEAYRVLKPGGVFLGVDSTWSLRMWAFHLRDTLVTVDPSKLSARLEAANFTDVAIESKRGRFRFFARRPAGHSNSPYRSLE
jgi:SAM-dependent methyltransferase